MNTFMCESRSLCTYIHTYLQYNIHMCIHVYMFVYHHCECAAMCVVHSCMWLLKVLPVFVLTVRTCTILPVLMYIRYIPMYVGVYICTYVCMLTIVFLPFPTGSLQIRCCFGGTGEV